MKEFTAVSLFCGAGGLDLGFDRAGFRTLWANDFNEQVMNNSEPNLLINSFLSDNIFDG